MYQQNDLTMRCVERRDLELLRTLHNHPSTLGMLSDTTGERRSKVQMYQTG